VIRVSELYLYPIKSCRGVSVAVANVGDRGFVGDRRWMLVDERGRFVTQRETPELALITTELGSDRILVHASSRFGPRSPLELPLELLDGSDVEVEIWRDRARALADAPGSRWFSEALGKKLGLVYMPDATERSVRPEHALPGDIVSFADAYPFLLTSQASLDDLNQRLDFPVTMLRFRPNIVIAGSETYEEDGWSDLLIGSIAFRVPKPCDRCSVPAVDPETGERGKEPIRTLAQYRKRDDKVWFGINLIHGATGTIRRGDTVQVLTRRRAPSSIRA
jgi:hypothetical protein